VRDIVMFVHTIMRHSFNCMVQQNIREILQQIIISGKKDYSFTAQVYCKLMGEKFYEITTDGTSRDRPNADWRVTISQEYKWLRISIGLDDVFNVVIPQNIDFISPGRRFFVGMNIDFGKIK